MSNTIHNLYNDEIRKYFQMIIDKKMILWTSNREYAKKFNRFNLFIYKLYLKLFYKVNVRRSSLARFETKIESKMNMK